MNYLRFSTFLFIFILSLNFVVFDAQMLFDPLCKSRHLTTSIIDSAAIYGQKVFLFVDQLVYEVWVNETNGVIRDNPMLITSKWTYPDDYASEMIHLEKSIDATFRTSDPNGVQYLYLFQKQLNYDWKYWSINLNSRQFNLTTKKFTRDISSGSSKMVYFSKEYNSFHYSLYNSNEEALQLKRCPVDTELGLNCLLLKIRNISAENKVEIIDGKATQVNLLDIDLRAGFDYNKNWYLFGNDSVLKIDESIVKVANRVKPIKFKFKDWIVCDVRGESSTLFNSEIFDESILTKGHNLLITIWVALIILSIIIVCFISFMYYICGQKAKNQLSLKSEDNAIDSNVKESKTFSQHLSARSSDVSTDTKSSSKVLPHSSVKVVHLTDQMLIHSNTTLSSPKERANINKS